MSETSIALHTFGAITFLVAALFPDTEEKSPDITYKASLGARLMFVALALGVASPILFLK